MHFNLHCGNTPKELYVNWDIRPNVIKDGINESLDRYYFYDQHPETLESMIVNRGALENFMSIEIPEIIKRWIVLLKPEGSLEIQIFDVNMIANNFLHGHITLDALEQILIKEFQSLLNFERLMKILKDIKEIEIMNISTYLDSIQFSVRKKQTNNGNTNTIQNSSRTYSEQTV